MTDARDVGRRIADRYVIESRLGAGGMGVVFRARDQRLDRPVAIKLLSPETVGDGVARARLIREAHSAAALDHAGIVHVYDVGETDDGGAYLVMELVRGQSLGSYLAEHSVGPRKRTAIILEVARTVGEAHRRGFAHRDIKPDNVMVRDDGRVVVLDFGLAKAVSAPVTDAPTNPEAMLARTLPGDGLTHDGMIVGTPAFLAPEQAMGRPVDGRADQFSLGVMAYELLAGRSPWRGANVRAVMAELLTENPAPPSSVAPELSTALDDVLLRALEKEPAKRFPTMEAFADALAAVPLPSEDGSSRSLDPSVFAATMASGPNIGGLPTLASPTPMGMTTVPLSAPRRASRWALVIVAVASCAVAIVARVRSRNASRTSGPLASHASRLACPVFSVRGVAEPSAWLGATAADMVCARVTALFAGDVRRTLPPAELLDLPHAPATATNIDAWNVAGARDRSLAAARQRATAYIDGEVNVTPRGLSLSLSLRTADGREIGHGDGNGAALFLAVRAATSPLVGPSLLPRSVDADPSLTPWTRIGTSHAAGGFFNYMHGIHGPTAPDECSRVEGRGRDLAGQAAVFRARCLQTRVETAAVPARRIAPRAPP
jgi:serine/threonine protein kinase